MQPAQDEELAEEPVTLCIAAECEHEGKPAIVMCCDWLARRGSLSQELVSSDDVYKIRDIDGASALLAGSETDADELLNACESAIRRFCATPADSASDLAITTFLAQLREAATVRKKQIVEHHVSMGLGIDYKALREIPRNKLTDVQEEVWHGVRSLSLGADVIVCAFAEEAVIVRLDRYGTAHWETNYSVIGEGADIALAFLCQQAWDLGGSSRPPILGPTEPMPLMQCLYRVYEAKKAAEKNRSVGEATAFNILIRGQKASDISDRCRDVMYDAFSKKNHVPDLTFDSSFLEEHGPVRSDT